MRMRLKANFNLRRAGEVLVLLALAGALLGGSALQAGDIRERARRFTRPVEFDFTAWTLRALWGKWEMLSVGGARFLPSRERVAVVEAYFAAVQKSRQAETDLQEALADPRETAGEVPLSELRTHFQAAAARKEALTPWAEAVLESQVSAILFRNGLTFGGQPIPPVSFHLTRPPRALIVSPREVIRQEADISLQPNLSPDTIQNLETEVERSLNVSALVERTGGIGVYPTMVLESTDLNWVCEVVAHEWTHNYLDWHPLGLRYNASPEMRTINETTATISGQENGALVVQTYYPERVPPPPAPPPPASGGEQNAPPPFDFQREMHHTRVVVDRLLSEGQVERAEWYMEVRRRYFWEHGYHLRKLNQAYFAFHGAYAAAPEGAAGEDPVGEAVRLMRKESPSVGVFVRRMAWVTSWPRLQRMAGAEGNADGR